MDLSREIFPYLLAWIPALAYFLWRYLKRPETSVGLIPVFLFNMWMYYWIAGLSHYFAAGALEYDDRVLAGIKECTFALYMFTIGVLMFSRPLAKSVGWLSPHAPETPDLNLPVQYVISGFVCQLALGPTIGRLPGLNALTAVGGGLVMVGLVIGAWKAWVMGGRRALYRWLGVCAMMPLVTVIGSGFLGAGSLTLITVIIFITRFFRPRWMLVAGFFIGAFIGMSVYVTYTRDKTEIRGVVWGGASLSDRVDRILLTVSTVEWFTPSNITHLEYIDDRLNQVSFVGAGVQHLANTQTFLKGETIWNAIIGLIPRAIWRDKPMVAGSGDLVSRLTGLEFAEGTSVGVGPVLELYGNFGRWGVIIGFLLFGAVLGAVDLVAAYALDGGDWQRFGLWFLVGSAFTQLTGSLFEISTSVIGAVVVGRVTNTLLKKRRQRRASAPVPVLS